MTYGEIVNLLNGKEFYSESFGGERVTVNGISVVTESGRLIMISSREDVRDLYEDYKKENENDRHT
jgi:hypothetical protein